MKRTKEDENIRLADLVQDVDLAVEFSDVSAEACRRAAALLKPALSTLVM